ncbi:MAG: mevalonate kinase [DPANN group archaeon]|nr:mevalonate kinase [DPANN group archaeon]
MGYGTAGTAGTAKVQQSIVAEACAKVILFGEHGVVYGTEGIAAPVRSLKTRIMIEPGQGLQVFFDGAPDSSADERHERPGQQEKDRSIIVELVLFAARKLRIDALDARVHVSSTIPFSAGLGSSASLSVAILRALAAFGGKDISDDMMDALAFSCESRFHAKPSGIDNTVIVREQVISFQDKASVPLSLGKPLTLLIADSGIRADTKAVQKTLSRQYRQHSAEMEGIFKVMDEVVQNAKVALVAGDLKEVGSLMNQNHGLLQDLGVSSEPLDTLVKIAREEGASGAKLSGAGKGGIIIASVPDDAQQSDRIKGALEKQGAKVHRVVIA